MGLDPQENIGALSGLEVIPRLAAQLLSQGFRLGWGPVAQQHPLWVHRLTQDAGNGAPHIPAADKAVFRLDHAIASFCMIALPLHVYENRAASWALT